MLMFLYPLICVYLCYSVWLLKKLETGKKKKKFVGNFFILEVEQKIYFSLTNAFIGYGTMVFEYEKFSKL